MKLNFARFSVLTAVLLISSTYSAICFAKHYNSINMSCEISGSEVSLTPTNAPGPRIRKISYPSKIKYVLNDVVYVSDSLPAVVWPISFTPSVNEHEFPVELEDSQEGPRAFDQFHAPEVRVSLAHAQTSVRLDFSRDQLIELLIALGSPTADTFHSATNSGFNTLEFSRTRYVLTPELFKAVKPAFDKHRGIQPSRDLPLEFTGWYGRRDLETCYQIDPVNFEAPEDLYFNGLAYHLCGVCKVDPLESSSPVFAPSQNSIE